MFHAFVLGLVQGLGEFLPISSSAHLIIVPWLFRWEDPGLGFDVALHWGTLIAVLFYFRNDVWLLIKGFWHSLFKATRDFDNNIYQKLAWLLIIASIPAAVIGKLLENAAEKSLRQPLLVAVDLAVFGVILWVVDRWASQEKNLNKITKSNALLIGFSQALAIIPGISRSGATMVAARALKFTRADAARFSFLMSIPIIFGAGILKLPEFNQGVTLPELAVGFATAAISGFFAIKYLIRYLGSHSFSIFVIYRLLLAGVILALYFTR
jgi:undecaprenyl-diphosphatase